MLESLPKDLVYEMGLNIDPDDIFRACQVNKQWAKICADNSFWRQYYSKWVKYHPIEPGLFPPEWTNWRHNFQQNYRRPILLQEYWRVGNRDYINLSTNPRLLKLVDLEETPQGAFYYPYRRPLEIIVVSPERGLALFGETTVRILRTTRSFGPPIIVNLIERP